MSIATSSNPADEAAKLCLAKVFAAVNNKSNFRVEAGAGAGKTYTLVKVLKYLIETKGKSFLKARKQIACITYTNVAKDEIISRIDNHPVVFSETIHAFSWSLLKDFQKPLRKYIGEFTGKWKERLDENGGVGEKIVAYDFGYPKVTEHHIYLHHDDVIALMSLMLNEPKFKAILTDRFPVIFIDEYQDTNNTLAASMVGNFIEPEQGPLIGLFGDHWQKIYGSSSCGLIASDKLEEIGKNANFRSDKLIVEALNRIRPDLPQNVCDPLSTGEITVFHTNNWAGTRRTEPHWKGDLPEKEAHEYLDRTKSALLALGWEFSYKKTKILMLTNNVLATEQGYSSVSDAFQFPDDYLKKTNDYISFFIDTVIPGCEAFEKRKYADMFAAFNTRTPKINKPSDKVIWNGSMCELVALKTNGTVGEIVELLKRTQKPRLSPRIEEKEKKIGEILEIESDLRTPEQNEEIEKLNRIKALKYSEIKLLSEYIDDKTIFSTNHGVKGEEYENVLVVLGRGWNLYNWTQMLEWANNGIPKGKIDTFERSRNLFYVACSRPMKRLALLFTQELSQSALDQIGKWFGPNVKTFS